MKSYGSPSGFFVFIISVTTSFNKLHPILRYNTIMKKKVAIFDIDGTIFRSSLLIELVNVLIDRKIFPYKARKEFDDEYNAWLNRKGDYQAYIGAVVKTFIKYIRGIHKDEIIDASHVVYEHHKNRIYRYTRDLTRELKGRGYYLLAISHSPKLVLDEFGKNLGFDKIYGTIYEWNEAEEFTGRIRDEELIFDKSKILIRAVEKEGLTLKSSVGVGDTESDIVFLKMVDKPICFNPNQKLYKEAKKCRWKIVVERKDVIYEF